jgi:hypothetical protein
MGGSAASRTGDDTGAAGGAEALALETLHRDWGSAWAIGCGGGRWRAAYRGAPGPVLTRASAPGLDLALRAGYGRGFL